MNPWQKVRMPRIKVPLTKVDWLLEVVALILLLVFIGITLSAWDKLPDIVPAHLNGQAGKNTLRSLAPWVVGIYMLLTIVAHFPRTFNYPVEITERNAAKQYKMANTLMRLLKLELMVVFSSFEFLTIHSFTKHQTGILVLVILSLSFVVILGTLGDYISRSSKME